MADKLSAEAAAQPYKQARETQDEVDALRAHAAAAERVADKWNSNQAEAVRKLRTQRDELLAALEEIEDLCDWPAETLAILELQIGDCARAAVARCKEK